MKRFKNFIKRIIKGIFFNPKGPFYSKLLFDFSRKYVGFWYGEAFPDPENNGEFRILKIIAPKSSIIFDVGANVGKFSEEVVKINPNIEMHLFEPDKECFSILKSKFSADKKININNVALGESEGEKIFYLQDRSVLNSFYNTVLMSSRPAAKVKIEKLDDYYKKNNIAHIDFLKIDTEGHDFFVLMGAEILLDKLKIDFIQFEITKESIYSRVFLRNFINLFKKYDYNLYRIRPTSLFKVDGYSSEEIFTYINFLAISPKADKKITEELIG